MTDMMRCERCRGRGWVYVMPDDLMCPRCKGAGLVPTELGQEVLL